MPVTKCEISYFYFPKIFAKFYTQFKKRCRFYTLQSNVLKIIFNYFRCRLLQQLQEKALPETAFYDTCKINLKRKISLGNIGNINFNLVSFERYHSEVRYSSLCQRIGTFFTASMPALLSI